MNRLFYYTIIGCGTLGATSGLVYGVNVSKNNFPTKKLTPSETLGECICASSIVASSGITGFLNGVVIGFFSPVIIPAATYYLYKSQK